MIRSYASRHRKISPHRQQIYAALATDYCIPFKPTHLAFQTYFVRQSPLVVEIGFGNGDATVAMAQHNPSINYLAIDVYTSGVIHLLQRINDLKAKNIKVIHHDAVAVLETMIPPQTVSGFHIFFPDPWPKKRHHKRRLIQPWFVAKMVETLQVGGYIYLVTDWPGYATHAAQVLSNHTNLSQTSRDIWRPRTPYELRGAIAGRPITSLIFEKYS